MVAEYAPSIGAKVGRRGQGPDPVQAHIHPLELSPYSPYTMKSNGENIALPEFDFHQRYRSSHGSQMLKDQSRGIFPFVPVHGTKEYDHQE